MVTSVCPIATKPRDPGLRRLNADLGMTDLRPRVRDVGTITIGVARKFFSGQIVKAKAK